VSRSVIIVDQFASEAEQLRTTFEERFADPRSTRSDRFVWDYWHVPGQYTALRTPAWTYFPKKLYEAFHSRLVQWGRETLGCHDISPPWLSCYVEGCGQQFHGDLPHGPWAFVYSLTPWKNRVFRGGETLLLRDDVLDFWSDFQSVRGTEESEILRAIEPKFGRLTVFDPRIPHGVRTVTGTHDPRQGRLVIHGWFVQPRPFIEGPLQPKQLQSRIEELSGFIGKQLSSELPVAGLLSLQVNVTPSGAVRLVKVLSDTTRVPALEEPERVKFIAAVRKVVGEWKFPKQKSGSKITLPLVFERQ
jgi:hypothetical protein